MSTLIHTAGMPGMQLPAKMTQQNPSARPEQPKRDVLRQAQEYRDLTGRVWYSSLGCSD